MLLSTIRKILDQYRTRGTLIVKKLQVYYFLSGTYYLPSYLQLIIFSRTFILLKYITRLFRCNYYVSQWCTYAIPKLV